MRHAMMNLANTTLFEKYVDHKVERTEGARASA
jgi:hypothetical protein